MPDMHAVDASPAPLTGVAPRSGVIATLLVPVGTVVAILALAILPLLTPWFVHAALDYARADAWLRLSPAATHALSDRTVAELVLGPGAFAFVGRDQQPFYDPSEVSHLRDARTLLYLLLGAGLVSSIAIGVPLARRPDRASTWRGIGRGGAAVVLGVVVLAVGGLLAFGPLFELFHRVFFPGGNWAFDPRTQHLVQLYPFAFWQVATAAFGVLALSIGLVAWVIGRRRAGR
jgi:integral membrane protein (TIGR01906 family)